MPTQDKKEVENDNMTDRTIIKILLTLLILVSIFSIASVKIADYEVQAKTLYFKKLAEHITYGLSSDYDKLIALNEYAYNSSFGVCSQKSLYFESLARGLGYKTRHVAEICAYDENDNPSVTHALSGVYFNNTFAVFDPYYNRMAPFNDGCSYDYALNFAGKYSPLFVLWIEYKGVIL